MNQRHLWTTVALFLAVLGMPSVGRTQTVGEAVSESPASPAPEVVKVGEYKTTAGQETPSDVITQIHPHIVGGRQAATLFVRNIPVVTFLGSTPAADAETKVGAIGNGQTVQQYASVAAKTTQSNVGNVLEANNQSGSVADDPVQRASLLAARINQLVQENADASQITVSWKAGVDAPAKGQTKNNSNQQERYTIAINDQELVEINQNTILPDTTKNLSQDALQATNRLRRLVGNASPIQEVANLPKGGFSLDIPQQVAMRGVKLNFRGIASWYGYDGSGTRTANGERFNPEALTAAHRTLPMGTKVRVTNTRNGRSVVVRINDRGPYIGGRIIDVSAGAARLLGMMGSGLAPVRVEVLGR
ncbi:MAG TPA: septal ring lytic transglycosylase RlpA family protein [Nostocaceae cyanobacterium]|nr:septal ring lytic transglycosylase RlpA family protein [Nostocaceae cyanobacterium]